MATTPSFIGSPVVGQATINTANTSITQTAGVPSSGANLITGATNGTRVLEIVTQAAGTTAAGLINVWISTDGTGASFSIFDQITVSVANASATVKGHRNTATYANLVLKSGHRLAVTTTISQAMSITALGGDL
jgi:hypothetical protein